MKRTIVMNAKVRTMAMEHRDTISLVLKTMSRMWEKSSWCGETHIQKNIFFLQELMDVPFEWSFIIYKYGPFSFDLSYLIAEIHSYGLIELVPQWGFRPKIKVTRYGKEFYEDVNELCFRYSKQIEFVAEELGSKNVSELERLATGLHITFDKNVENKTLNKRISRLNQLKPHIKLNDAQVVMGEVDSLIERARMAQSEMQA